MFLNHGLLEVSQHFTCQRHTFRQPAKPMEPPTPRGSLLGLDRLALEKRTAAANGNGEGSRKRPRIHDGPEPFFKGGVLYLFNRLLLNISSQFLVFQLPARVALVNELKRHLVILEA